MKPRRRIKPLTVVSCALLFAACGRSGTDATPEPAASPTAAVVATTVAPTTSPVREGAERTKATTTASGQLPLLLPSHLPASFAVVEASVTPADVADPEVTPSWRVVASDGSATIDISVAPGDAADVERLATAESSIAGVSVTATEVQGTPAWLVSYDGTTSSTLLWFGFGVEVQISGDASPEIVLSIANALELVDDAAWHRALDPVMDIEVHAAGQWEGAAWTVDVSYGPQGWCAEVINDISDPSVCEPTNSGRDADFVVLSLVDEPLVVGVATATDAARAELRNATGSVLATADLVTAEDAAFRVFVMWPSAAGADPASVVVLLDADGTELARAPYLAG